MSEALAKYDAGFNPDQIALIKSQIAKGCTDDELKLFIQQCQRTGLDPFSKQIYAIRRKQKERGSYVERMSIQVSIDGFRVIAERTGEMDGQTVEWCGPDEVWREVWLPNYPPMAARVLVYRKGCSKPFPGIAIWDEYVQKYEGKPSGMWDRMPSTMLAKCAESLALRKAFPNDLSGLYTTEEMGQAERYNDPTERDYSGGMAKTPDQLREVAAGRAAREVLNEMKGAPDEIDGTMIQGAIDQRTEEISEEMLTAKITPAEVKDFIIAAKGLGWTDEEMKKLISPWYASRKDIERRDYQKLTEMLQDRAIHERVKAALFREKMAAEEGATADDDDSIAAMAQQEVGV